MKLLKLFSVIILTLTRFVATSQTPPLYNDLRLIESWPDLDEEQPAKSEEECVDPQPQEDSIVPEAEIEAQIQTQPEVVMPKNAVVYRHEVFAGYGALSNAEVVSVLSGFLHTVFTLGGHVESNLRYTGTVSVGYKYRFDRTISLGVTYAYGSMRGDAYENGEYWGRSVTSHHSLAVECDFRYLTRRVVNLYSTVGLGGTFLRQRGTPLDPREDKTSVGGRFVDFQLSLIGVKLGGYRFGGYAELGFGYKGMFSFGAYARF